MEMRFENGDLETWRPEDQTENRDKKNAMQRTRRENEAKRALDKLKRDQPGIIHAVQPQTQTESHRKKALKNRKDTPYIGPALIRSNDVY